MAGAGAGGAGAAGEGGGGGRYGLILGHITGSKDCLYKGRVK